MTTLIGTTQNANHALQTSSISNKIAPHVYVCTLDPNPKAWMNEEWFVRNRLRAYTDFANLRTEYGEYSITSEAMQINPPKDIGQANIALSLSANGLHAPMLDIDAEKGCDPSKLPDVWKDAKGEQEWSLYWRLLPSSTEGNYHAWCDGGEMPWHEFEAFLLTAASEGWADPAWCDISIKRGFGALRLPSVRK